MILPESRTLILENIGLSREDAVSASEYEVAGEGMETAVLGWERGSGWPVGAGFRREVRESIFGVVKEF